MAASGLARAADRAFLARRVQETPVYDGSMKRLAFALALVLFALPAAVFADDAPSAALAAPRVPQ